MQIRQEIQKLLDVGFIKPIHHLIWLANVVPINKKNEQTRCINFCNFHKGCLEDEFSFQSIDMLVETTIGHSMFSSWIVLVDITRPGWIP